MTKNSERVNVKHLRFASIVSMITGFITSCVGEKPRLPSAADNVFIIEHVFTIPKLNRSRQIRVYLPPNYESSEQSFPVLYMHDGQNLFDDATSYAGEWGVDETLNQLHRDNQLSLIVVGIDNGGEKRMNELSPWPNKEFGAAEGKAYMDFIVNTIKPYIDVKYRTLSNASNTGIMGSSMGGFISHYAAFDYSSTFSKAGIFSPSYWFSEDVFDFSQTQKLRKISRLYFLMGGEEGRDMVDDFNKMTLMLRTDGLTDSSMSSRVVPDGEHNEAFWREEFRRAVLWLFDSVSE